MPRAGLSADPRNRAGAGVTPGLARAIKTRAEVLAAQQDRLAEDQRAAIQAEANSNPTVRRYFQDIVDMTRRRIAELQRVEEERIWRNPPPHPKP